LHPAQEGNVQEFIRVTHTEKLIPKAVGGWTAWRSCAAALNPAATKDFAKTLHQDKRHAG
jgi:hypothetical protein